MQLARLHPLDISFPPTDLALRDPNGLLAVGGDLSPARLLEAYRHGIFPWYDASQPILWWTPDPRMVLFPEGLHVSRSLKRRLRSQNWQYSADREFAEVIDACAAPRSYAEGTWLTPEMRSAYLRLHELGHAHSVEVWDGDALVGGLYGIALGRVFFGESMFSRESGASKAAFVHLVGRLQAAGFALIDCQVHSEHLASMGAVEIPRQAFEAILKENVPLAAHPGAWLADFPCSEGFPG